MPKFKIEMELTSINDRLLLTNFDSSENSIGGLTFNENLSEEENGLYRLTFSLSEEIREYQDINFAKLIAIGRPLWLQLYEPRRSIRMVITSYSPVIGSENIIYEIEAQDYASYTFSRNNAGLTLDTIDDEEFLDWLRLYGKQDIVFLGSTTEEPDPTPTPTPIPVPTPSPSTPTTTPFVTSNEATSTSVSFNFRNRDSENALINYKLREGSSTGDIIFEDDNDFALAGLEEQIVVFGGPGQESLKNETLYFLTDVFATAIGKLPSTVINPVSLRTLDRLSAFPPTEWTLIESRRTQGGSDGSLPPSFDESIIVNQRDVCVTEAEALEFLNNEIPIQTKERGYVVKVEPNPFGSIVDCFDFYYVAGGPLKYDISAKQFDTSLSNLSVSITIEEQVQNILIGDEYTTLVNQVNEGSSFTVQADQIVIENSVAHRFLRWRINGVAQPLNQRVFTAVLNENVDLEVQYEIAPEPLIVRARQFNTNLPDLPVNFTVGEISQLIEITDTYKILGGTQNETLTFTVQAQEFIILGGTTHRFKRWYINGVAQETDVRTISETITQNTDLEAEYEIFQLVIVRARQFNTNIPNLSINYALGTTSGTAEVTDTYEFIEAGRPRNSFIVEAVFLIAGHRFKRWYIDGVEQPLNQRRIELELSEDVDLEVEYELI